MKIRRVQIRIAEAMLVCILSGTAGFSQPAEQHQQSYFFKALPYGSESIFNPISILVNGGFDELQVYGHHSGNLEDVPWRIGVTNVWKNIIDPLTSIKAYGVNRFISQEIIPTSVSYETAQWFPNWTLHVVGGGMEFRKTKEWYEFHDYPMPWVLSATTVMAYHYINEIVENRNSDGPNVDPIADLLIFDPLGLVLFSIDGVAEFFSSTLSLNDWSSQPALSFKPLAVRNVAQSFVMKYPITESGKTSLFYHFGNFGMLGLSFKMNPEESISFGIGIATKGIYDVDFAQALTRAITATPSAGVYFDRNNSLLASIAMDDGFNDVVRINVFPGILSIGGYSPGIFLAFGRQGAFTVGITARILPVGIAVYRPGWDRRFGVESNFKLC